MFVITQLVRSKGVTCLLYAVKGCPINNSQVKSQDFTINRVFQTQSIDVFSIDGSSALWTRS